MMSVLLSVILLILSGLLIFMIVSRANIGQVQFSWYGGLLYGLPYFPTFLLVFSISNIALISMQENESLLSTAMLLVATSVLLFLWGWMFNEKYVTRTHIILNPILKSKWIKLSDIKDFYLNTQGLFTHITLILDNRPPATFTTQTRYAKLISQHIESARPEKDHLKSFTILINN